MTKSRTTGDVKAEHSGIISMIAKFSSVCKCGAFIEPGDSMSYDTVSRKSLCFDCVRRETQFSGAAKQFKTEAERIAEAKCCAIVDRLRTLRLAPRPISAPAKEELKVLLCMLKNEYANNELARTVVSEIAKCKHSGARVCPIKTKYAGSCIHCGQSIVSGELVLYDHHARRVHCLICDCMRGL